MESRKSPLCIKLVPLLVHNASLTLLAKRRWLKCGASSNVCMAGAQSDSQTVHHMMKCWNTISHDEVEDVEEFYLSSDMWLTLCFCFPGGMPDVSQNSLGKFSSGYVGCMKDVILATDFNIKMMNHAQSGRNIYHCVSNVWDKSNLSTLLPEWTVLVNKAWVIPNSYLGCDG